MNDLRSTDPEERPVERSNEGAVIEFRTHIQDRAVSCRWSGGQVSGDAELLRRVERTAGRTDWRRSPMSVADALAAAVACPVLMHVLDESALQPSTSAPTNLN